MYKKFVEDMDNLTGNCDAFGFKSIDGLSGQEEQEALEVCEKSKWNPFETNNGHGSNIPEGFGDNGFIK